MPDAIDQALDDEIANARRMQAETRPAQPASGGASFAPTPQPGQPPLVSLDPGASAINGLASTRATSNALNIARTQLGTMAAQSERNAPLSLGRNAPPESLTATPDLGFQARNSRLDAQGNRVPIVPTEGIALGDYFLVARQSGTGAQLEVLKQMYPDRSPRILDTGDLAIEVRDPKTGAPRDVTLNPNGVDAHDLIDLAVQTPEIAASIAAAVATSGTGPLATAGQIIASSLAGAATGVIRDVATRAREDIPREGGEILRSRGSAAVLDMFGQTALLGASKALGALSPFAKPIKAGSLEFDLARAQQLVKREFGEDFPLTAAEITGSPALRAVEAAETPQPGSRTVLGNVFQAGKDIVQRIQQRALGKVTPEEEIGEAAIDTLRDKVVLPLEEALTTARAAAEAKGQQRLLDEIDNAIGIGGSGKARTLSQAGDTALEDFEIRRAQAQHNVNTAYAKVNAIPGGSGDILDGTAAADAAKLIRNELPGVLKGGVKETLTSGIPENLGKALDDLESLRGGKVSLQTLTNMKRAAYDEIARTEAVPGVKEHWFNEIAKAYEEGIQRGIDATADPALKAALTRARDTYKRELLPFDRPGLKELARGEFDAGRLSPEQVATRLFEGPRAIENMHMLKEVLGANSHTLKVLKRAWIDSKLEPITDPITGSVSAKGLADVVAETRKRPELADELFGNNYRDLVEALRAQQGVQGLERLDAREVQTLLGLRNPGAADLAAVLRVQGMRDKAYVNGILKDIADGLPIASSLKPTELVSRLRNLDTPTADVASILTTLERESPEVRKAVATAQLYTLLDQASVSEAGTTGRLLRGEPLNLSATRLAEALGGAGTALRARNDLLLGVERLQLKPPVIGAAPAPATGPTRTEFAESLVALLAPREVKTQAFANLGSQAAGHALQQVTKGPLTYASNYAKKFALAVLYTTGMAQRLAANRVYTPVETAAIANVLIASEPFLLRATATLDSGKAHAVVADLKRSIDRFVGEQRRNPSLQQREADEIDKVLDGEIAKARLRIQAKP